MSICLLLQLFLLLLLLLLLLFFIYFFLHAAGIAAGRDFLPDGHYLVEENIFWDCYKFYTNFPVVCVSWDTHGHGPGG